MTYEPKIYLSRGVDAFPSGCPACGEVISDYKPGDGENLAGWWFVCGSAFLVDGLNCVEVYDECPEATNAAIERCLFVEE